MRLTAYKKAIDEANNLPESIPNLKKYFKVDYNPRHEAIKHIIKKARLDVDGLFHGEFCELYVYTIKPLR